MADAVKTFSAKEVATHTKKTDCWIIVHGKVYDATNFLDEHPGGGDLILDVAGTDASEPFDDIGHTEDALDALSDLLVGDLDAPPVVAKKAAAPPPPRAPASPEDKENFALWSTIFAAIVAGAGLYYKAVRH